MSGRSRSSSSRIIIRRRKRSSNERGGIVVVVGTEGELGVFGVLVVVVVSSS